MNDLFDDPALALLPSDDEELVQRYRAGDQRAAALLYRKYSHRLYKLARSFSGRNMACRFDPEDVVQSVFRVFFARVNGGTCSVPEGGELWGYLMVLAISKLRNLASFHLAQRRSVAKTESWDALDGTGELADGKSADAVMRLVLSEQLDQLEVGDRPIIQMRLEGHEVAEIARQTGRALRTVERVLHDFRHQISAAD